VASAALEAGSRGADAGGAAGQGGGTALAPAALPKRSRPGPGALALPLPPRPTRRLLTRPAPGTVSAGLTPPPPASPFPGGWRGASRRRSELPSRPPRVERAAAGRRFGGYRVRGARGGTESCGRRCPHNPPITDAAPRRWG